MKSNFFEKLIINKDEKTKEKIREMSNILDDSFESFLKIRKENNYIKERNNKKIINDNKIEINEVHRFINTIRFIRFIIFESLLNADIQSINNSIEERT